MREVDLINHNSTNLSDLRAPVAQALLRARETIVSTWVDRVKAEVKTAESLSSPVITNTIPLFLEELADALSDDSSPRIATETSNIAEEHGGERARVTRYGPDQIIHEYQILHDVIREEICRSVNLKEIDEETIRRSINTALREAMSAYFLVHSKMKEQFTATLTHDLRQPLNVMSMAAQMILRHAKKPLTEDIQDDIVDLATRAVVNARRADRMIRDLLDASAIHFGERLSVSIEPCDVQRIVLDAVAERVGTDAKRLKVENKSVTGFWDCEAFQRSIENLITNAFKYGRGDGVVTLSVQSSHGRVMVSVHNDGNPIPEENREDLFQIFRRAQKAKAGSQEGWGIGLAFVRSFTEQMGGSIAIDSSLERGTTFTLDIPCDARPFQGSND